MTFRLGDDVDNVHIDPEAGGRIASAVMNGRERLITEPCLPAVDPSLAWGCYLMAPFVGRANHGLIEWNGKRARLKLNHSPHAIHGVVFDERWTVTEQSDRSATLTCRFDPERWPFAGVATQRYSISPGRLAIEAEIFAEEPMPAAFGWHPWFRRDHDETQVRLEARRTLVTDPELIPTGATEPVTPAKDLRAARTVDRLELDDAFAGASSPATLTFPDLELTIAFDDRIETVVVYVHPVAVCVEPQTAWPDSAHLWTQGVRHTGLASLEAGDRLVASTTWTWKAR